MHEGPTKNPPWCDEGFSHWFGDQRRRERAVACRVRRKRACNSFELSAFVIHLCNNPVVTSLLGRICFRTVTGGDWFGIELTITLFFFWPDLSKCFFPGDIVLCGDWLSSQDKLAQFFHISSGLSVIYRKKKYLFFLMHDQECLLEAWIIKGPHTSI